MLKCRFCCFSRNKSKFIIGFCTLLQGTVMLVLSLLAIWTYECKWDMTRDPFSYMMYLIYFFNRDCGEVDWKRLGLQMPSQLQPLFNGNTSQAAKSTYDIAWLYFFYSIYLIIGSLALLVGSCPTPKSYICNFFTIWPWILTVGANVGLDVYATLKFWNDVKHTGSLVEFLQFLNILNYEEVLQYLPQYERNVFRLPSALMMLVTSRVVVIFVANVWFLFIMFLIYVEGNIEIGKHKKEQAAKSAEEEGTQERRMAIHRNTMVLNVIES